MRPGVCIYPPPPFVAHRLGRDQVPLGGGVHVGNTNVCDSGCPPLLNPIDDKAPFLLLLSIVPYHDRNYTSILTIWCAQKKTFNQSINLLIIWQGLPYKVTLWKNINVTVIFCTLPTGVSQNLFPQYLPWHCILYYSLRVVKDVLCGSLCKSDGQILPCPDTQCCVQIRAANVLLHKVTVAVIPGVL